MRQSCYVPTIFHLEEKEPPEPNQTSLHKYFNLPKKENGDNAQASIGEQTSRLEDPCPGETKEQTVETVHEDIDGQIDTNSLPLQSSDVSK
ncbi:hypothetical protein BSL78_20232 [Apostichopus japonicus]|uniref:Uncharacterized protein n=1 Tax=Stichopus japonicus TaxID=307972 RepID=A0A2G8K4P0_STIJA|nr:hypothetical protein BSL78_20232 [Apostichopus japonicus]